MVWTLDSLVSENVSIVMLVNFPWALLYPCLTCIPAESGAPTAKIVNPWDLLERFLSTILLNRFVLSRICHTKLCIFKLDDGGFRQHFQYRYLRSKVKAHQRFRHRKPYPSARGYRLANDAQQREVSLCHVPHISPVWLYTTSQVDVGSRWPVLMFSLPLRP